MTMNHRRSSRTRRCAAALLALCALAGCATLPLQEDERIVRLTHEAQAGLEVTTANGPIEVRRTTRDDVLIEARIRAAGSERLAGTRLVTSRGEDGTLSVSFDWADGRRRNNESGSIRIELPEASGITARTSNGRILIEGLAGSADLRNSNGRITVLDHDGPVSARSSNGRAILSAITGNVDVTTSNGRIEAHGISGAASLRTSNGSITLELTEAARGPVDIQSSNGGISLTVGQSFAGELALRTSRGRVQVDAGDTDLRLRSLERNRAILAFPGEGEPSRVRTSNGNIRLAAHDGPGNE